jgi:rod shape-determining protein MreC
VVGYVEEVRTDASGMTQYAVVVPETDLASLKQVFVITDFDVVE